MNSKQHLIRHHRIRHRHTHPPHKTSVGYLPPRQVSGNNAHQHSRVTRLARPLGTIYRRGTSCPLPSVEHSSPCAFGVISSSRETATAAAAVVDSRSKKPPLIDLSCLTSSVVTLFQPVSSYAQHA